MCTVDFILKPVHPALLSACVLAKVVMAEAELNNTVHQQLQLMRLSRVVLYSNVQPGASLASVVSTATSPTFRCPIVINMNCGMLTMAKLCLGHGKNTT